MRSEIDRLPINAGIPGTANEDIPDLQPKFAQDFSIHAVNGVLSVAPKVPDFCPQVEQKPQAECLARQGCSELHILGVHQANPAPASLTFQQICRVVLGNLQPAQHMTCGGVWVVNILFHD